jgi:hypothetical protein
MFSLFLWSGIMPNCLSVWLLDMFTTWISRRMRVWSKKLSSRLKERWLLSTTFCLINFSLETRWHSKNISNKSKRPGQVIPWTLLITRTNVVSSGDVSEISLDASSSTHIRGWDDLFNKCGENLNSLTAMKLSPYYKGISHLTRNSCPIS